jgi:hypothetical protein
MVDENRVDVSFGAKTSELDAAFNKIKEAAKGVGEKVKEGFNPAAIASTALGFSIAKLGEEITTHIREAVSEAIHAYAEWGGELEHLQHRIGGSAESLSELKVALESVGISQSQYESIARRLPMVLEQNADKFKAAGVAYADAHNNLLPVSEVIQNISTHLEQFTAGSARNAEGVKLLGRSYAQYADMVELTKSRTAEATIVAHEFGLVMSEEDLRAAQEFEVQTSLLSQAIKGLYVTTGEALTPALTALATDCRELLIPVFDVLSVLMKTIGIIFDGLVMSVTLIVIALASLWESFVLGIKILGAMTQVLKGDFDGGLKTATEAVNAYNKRLKELGDTAIKTASALNAHMGRTLFGKNAPATEEKGEQANFSNKNAAAELALSKALAEAEANLQKEYLREAQAVADDAYAHSEISTKEYYDTKLAIERAGIDASLALKRKELTESKNKKAKDPAETLQFAAEQAKLAGQINVLEAQRNDLVRKNTVEYTAAENARTSAMQKTLAQEQLNNSDNKLVAERALNKQKQDLRIIDAQTAFDLQKQSENKSFEASRAFAQKKLEIDISNGKDIEQKKADARMADEDAEAKHQQKLTDIDMAAELERKKYGLQAATAVQGAFSTMFQDMMQHTKSMSDIFKSFANSIIADIQRILAQKMAEQLMSAGSSDGGGSLGSLIGGLFGGGSSSGSGGAGGADLLKTGGGSTDYQSMIPKFAIGTNYVPNDMLAMIHKGERIIPAAQNNPAMLGANTGMTVYNNFTVSGNVDTRTQSQMATMAGISIQRAMARNS